MVFTNLIMTTHVNRIIDQPLMNSMAIRRYKNVDLTNLKGGYRESYVATTQTPNHRNGHFVRPNRVALKYPNFKKNDDLNVHLRVFNFVIKKNVETSKEYIINVFNYTLRDITLD